jgi:hypothetical protein
MGMGKVMIGDKNKPKKIERERHREKQRIGHSVNQSLSWFYDLL